MSHPRKTTREVRPVHGVIDPRCWYSVDGAMSEAGIGTVRLMEGRQAGILHPVNDGVRDWYRGDELIALVEWLGKKRRRPFSKVG